MLRKAKGGINIKYLWIGMYASPDVLRELIDTGYKPMSITIAQENLIRGIQKYTPIDTISGGRYPDFLQGGSLRFKGAHWCDADGSTHVLVDAFNVKYVELIYKKHAIKAAAKNYLASVSDERLTIFVYGLHSPYIACAKLIKKKHPQSRIVLIVPDLPEFYDFHMNSLKRILKKIDVRYLRKSLHICDQFILFTQQMAQYLHIEKDKYLVIEGSVCEDDLTTEPVPGNISPTLGKKIVMYSGGIGKGYGIENLLTAFSQINGNEWELWLAGAGNAVETVQACARSDARIKYHGFISDRKALLEMQRKATMLVCLLPPDNPAARYCFPSKLFEYLASGNPTLSFHLEGIPDEYRKHIVEIEENSPHGILSAIAKVAELPEGERRAFGQSAREFIVCSKTNTAQAKRMLDFLERESSTGLK